MKIFSKYLKKKAPEPTTEGTKTEEQIRKEITEEFQAKLDEITGFSDHDETLIRTINRHIIEFSQTYFRRLGLYDGTVGSKDFEIRATAAAYATRITDHVSSKITGRVAALGYLLTEKGKQVKELEVQKAERDRVLSNIQVEEREEYRLFNPILAYLYTFFGFLMIMSDIVLSINLVNYFGIGNTPEFGTSLWAKIADLELLFFSLGIAFCTIYIKALYDEYISSDPGYNIRERIRLLKQGITGNQLQSETILRHFIKGVLLLFLLWFLYTLSEYRTVFTMQYILTAYPELDKNQVGQMIKNCLVGISIIIPFISGIALSIGFKIFGRIRMLKNAKLLRDQVLEKLEALQNDHEKLTEKKAELSMFHNEWTSVATKKENITELFIANYNQGFRRNYRYNHGLTMYNIVKEYQAETTDKYLLHLLSSN